MTSFGSDGFTVPRVHQGQTAASVLLLARRRSNSCLSGFLIPPLAVLAVGMLLAFLSASLPTTAEAGSSVLNGDTHLLNRSTELAVFFTPEIKFWAGRIQVWAANSGLDPDLIATVMQIESCGDPRARSNAGAIGLFQVMPFHFQGSEDPYDPDTNAWRGLTYLKKSLDTAGLDERLALAGYNGGIGVISRSEQTWAAETQRYVYWGNGIYKDATQGAVRSKRLQEWLNRGGASLCYQAHQRIGIP